MDEKQHKFQLLYLSIYKLLSELDKDSSIESIFNNFLIKPNKTDILIEHFCFILSYIKIKLSANELLIFIKKFNSTTNICYGINTIKFLNYINKIKVDLIDINELEYIMQQRCILLDNQCLQIQNNIQHLPSLLIPFKADMLSIKQFLYSKKLILSLFYRSLKKQYHNQLTINVLLNVLFNELNYQPKSLTPLQLTQILSEIFYVKENITYNQLRNFILVHPNDQYIQLHLNHLSQNKKDEEENSVSPILKNSLNKLKTHNLRLIFKEFDVNQDGLLEIKDLYAILSSSYANSMNIYYIQSNWLYKNITLFCKKLHLKLTYQNFLDFIYQYDQYHENEILLSRSIIYLNSLSILNIEQLTQAIYAHIKHSNFEPIIESYDPYHTELISNLDLFFLLGDLGIVCDQKLIDLIYQTLTDDDDDDDDDDDQKLKGQKVQEDQKLEDQKLKEQKEEEELFIELKYMDIGKLSALLVNPRRYLRRKDSLDVNLNTRYQQIHSNDQSMQPLQLIEKSTNERIIKKDHISQVLDNDQPAAAVEPALDLSTSANYIQYAHEKQTSHILTNSNITNERPFLSHINHINPPGGIDHFQQQQQVQGGVASAKKSSIKIVNNISAKQSTINLSDQYTAQDLLILKQQEELLKKKQNYKLQYHPNHHYYSTINVINPKQSKVSTLHQIPRRNKDYPKMLSNTDKLANILGAEEVAEEDQQLFKSSRKEVLHQNIANETTEPLYRPQKVMNQSANMDHLNNQGGDSTTTTKSLSNYHHIRDYHFQHSINIVGDLAINKEEKKKGQVAANKVKVKVKEEVVTEQANKPISAAKSTINQPTTTTSMVKQLKIHQESEAFDLYQNYGKDEDNHNSQIMQQQRNLRYHFKHNQPNDEIHIPSWWLVTIANAIQGAGRPRTIFNQFISKFQQEKIQDKTKYLDQETFTKGLDSLGIEQDHQLMNLIFQKYSEDYGGIEYNQFLKIIMDAKY